jgi:iron(III) transport system ATP-binding protein
MARIELENVGKTFAGAVAAVADLTLSIPDGSFITLLGPSGCGKTTTLRMIAGLERPDRGEIRLDARRLFSERTGEWVPPERRGVGLVFQSYALWPHMTVEQNVAFGLEMKGVSRQERRERVGWVFELLHIGGLERRYPMQLSGGQQQRVALGRMLAISPDVLLLDEPLSNLDAKLRLETRAELKRLHAELRNTVVYVTHDQLEAMTLSTEIAVMSQGRLLQVAPPMRIYQQPATRFVAEFVGHPPINLFGFEERRGAEIARSILTFFPQRAARTRVVGVRPEAMMLLPVGTAPPARCWSHAATVETVLPTGSEWIIGLRVGAASAFVLTVDETVREPRQPITLVVELKHFHFFDGDGNRVD